MTISYGDVKKGMAIELDGHPYIVVEYEWSKMQQRAPVVRMRLREVRTGRVVDRTFQGYAVKLTPANIQRRNAQYIYEENGLHYFMDTETFEQFPVSKEQIGDAVRFLAEQATLDLVFYQDEPIAVEMPITVNLKVAETEPGVRGDTAQGGTKSAKLETGVVVQVPLFVDVDETVKIDTRTGEYLSRA